MVRPMIAPVEHDYLRRYEQALAGLRVTPGNVRLMHQAVLSLARSGALRFALAEYARYGLDKIKDDEDIMALGARLSKDLYLRSSGAIAAAHARDSALKYRAAFENTSGYYSGINALTMAVMAGMPAGPIAARVQTLLGLLPDPESLTLTDHYFIEATRAECYLLLGDAAKAKVHLKGAIRFDPLNYAAHATTLKQFRMILKNSAVPAGWLSSFNPPRALHYAGHINLNPSAPFQDSLQRQAVDHIQKHDIGFGYGALAAGSDIIIAEALLGEGAELHIVLPCPHDVFAEKSVHPFGAQWPQRYAACLERASSVTIISRNAPWPAAGLNRLTGQLTMGQAVMRARDFGVGARQLLIWDEHAGASYTALHARDWAQTGRAQSVILIDNPGPGGKPADPADDAICAVMMTQAGQEVTRFETASEALDAALAYCADDEAGRAALHIHVPGEEPGAALAQILSGGVPRSILMSDSFAKLLVLSGGDDIAVSFAGTLGNSSGAQNENPLRCYSLSGH